jgi:hypothetical protein
MNLINLSNFSKKNKQTFNKEVSNLNRKIGHNLFHFILDKKENNVNNTNKEDSNSNSNNSNNYFSLILKFDNDEVLNIFSAKIEYNNSSISLIDIKWQYNLNEEFINYVYSQCININQIQLFYDIMFIYYQVVQKQLEDFVYIYNNNGSLQNIKQYILFFYVFVQKKLFKNTSLLDNFKNNKFIEYYDIEFSNTFFLLANHENIFEENFELNIKLDIYFFFIFFTFDKQDILFNETLDIELLKKYFLENIYNFDFTDHLYNQMGRLYPSKNNQSKILLEYKNNSVSKQNIVDVSNVKNLKGINSKGRKIHEILNKKIKSKDFLLVANYFSSISIMIGTIIQIFIDLFKISFNKGGSDDINIRINIDNKKIHYNNKTFISLLGGFFLQPDFSFRHPNNTKYQNEKMSEQISEYDFNIDFSKKCVDIKINIKIKSCVMKILRMCIDKKIYPHISINLINIIIKLIKDNSRYLFFFYKLIHDFLNILNKEINEKYLNNIIVLLNMIIEYLEETNIDTNGIYEIFFIAIQKEDLINKNDMIIINNNEIGNYNFIDCIPILFKVLNNSPLFIVIRSQIIEQTSYSYVLEEYLIKIGFIRLEEEKKSIIPSFLRKKQNSNMIKIFHSNNINISEIERLNDKKVEFLKLSFEINDVKKNFVFVNSHIYFSNSKNNKKDKFLYLMNTKLFTDKKSLVELYKEEKYNICVFGNFNFKINNGNFNINFSESNIKTIWYALQQTSLVKYEFYIDKDNNMDVLSILF